MHMQSDSQRLTSHRHCSLPLELFLLDTKRGLQQILLLFQMRSLETSRHRCTWVSTRIHDVTPVVVLRLIQQRLDARLRKAPRTCVQRLFLCPDNVLCIRVVVEVLAQQLPWERMQLLDPRNGRVCDFVCDAVLVQRGKDLACAHYDTLDLILGVDLEVINAVVGWVRYDPFEARLAGELGQVRTSQWVSKE